MRKTSAFHGMVVMLAVLLIPLAGLLSPQPGFTRAQDKGPAVVPAVLGAVASRVLQPETDGECPPSGTVDLPPLSSALHILPPLGDSTGAMSDFDRSLADYLEVTVCAVVSGDGCTPVATFTSEKSGGGLDYIKLQDHHYHVNWKVAKADMGKAVEIRFAVAGLDVGLVSYTPKKNRAVPVKFQIDNHPQIRARVLHEQGHTATEVAQALVDEFGLEALETAWILAIQEGYSAVEVGQALKDVFALDASEAALILKDVGLSAVDVGWALKEVYDKDALGAAQILKDICFSPLEIGQALRDAFGLGAYDAGLVLKELGFNQYVIQSVLIEVYDTYAVIVDIKATVDDEPAPVGYTGLAYCSEETRCTEPYIPGLFGQAVLPSNIHRESPLKPPFPRRYVYVKYELVSKTSTQQVVTGIETHHWPYWEEEYVFSGIFPCD